VEGLMPTVPVWDMPWYMQVYKYILRVIKRYKSGKWSLRP